MSLIVQKFGGSSVADAAGIEVAGVESRRPSLDDVFLTVTGRSLRDGEHATEPAPESGLFWHDRVARPTSYRDATRPSGADVDRMWRWVQEALPELG